MCYIRQAAVRINYFYTVDVLECQIALGCWTFSKHLHTLLV